MAWLDRLYRHSVISLSASDAAANTVAINAALTAAKRTDLAVYVPPGRWPYSGPLWIDSATLAGESDSVLVGSDGTTTPMCGVYLGGYMPRLLGLSVEIDATARGRTNYHNGCTINFARGAIVRGVSIYGPAAYGLSNFGSVSSQIIQVVTDYSWADGIHHTHGSQHAETSGCTVMRSGDDYFPVVSYMDNDDSTRNILFIDCLGDGQRGAGRGLVVDGGEMVTFRRCTVRNVTQRGVYITTEDVYNTRAVQDVLLEDVLIDGCGLDGIDADPGAAGVWLGRQSDRSLDGVVTRRVVVKRSTGPISYDWRNLSTNVDFSGVTAG